MIVSEMNEWTVCMSATSTVNEEPKGICLAEKEGKAMGEGGLRNSGMA